jgi:hypothetical protein
VAEDDGVLPVIAAVEAGVGSKGRNLQKLGENAGFLADFGPDFLLPQVFNRDSIYRRCKRAILSILGKIFSPWFKVCTSSCQIWQLKAVNCPRWPLRATQRSCF